MAGERSARCFAPSASAHLLKRPDYVILQGSPLEDRGAGRDFRLIPKLNQLNTLVASCNDLTPAPIPSGCLKIALAATQTFAPASITTLIFPS
jgi:hypothetical protein